MYIYVYARANIHVYLSHGTNMLQLWQCHVWDCWDHKFQWLQIKGLKDQAFLESTEFDAQKSHT